VSRSTGASSGSRRGAITGRDQNKKKGPERRPALVEILLEK
jgi:hypothetical protein